VSTKQRIELFGRHIEVRDNDDLWPVRQRCQRFERSGNRLHHHGVRQFVAELQSPEFRCDLFCVEGRSDLGHQLPQHFCVQVLAAGVREARHFRLNGDAAPEQSPRIESLLGCSGPKPQPPACREFARVGSATST
jgi:hypothetical protein